MTMENPRINSVIERLEIHARAPGCPHLLIHEAIDLIKTLETQKDDLEAIVDEMDGGLCNYLNQVGDEFEPPSMWDEYCERDYKRLCEAYNRWHVNNRQIGDITMQAYKREQEKLRRQVVDELLSVLSTLRLQNNIELAADELETAIRRKTNR